MLFKKQISIYSNLVVKTLRMLSIDAITEAKSGHPGIALGAAPIMYALFRDHLNVNTKNPNYFNRDRFVLSAGHGSALLYATMLACNYKSITVDDLRKFRQLNSRCPGHPENHLLEGIDVSTGPLGQGIAMGVGLAIAESKLASCFNIYSKLINHHTYVLFGDGCLQEGVAQEAITIAGKLKLNKLIMLYDSNNIQLDGPVNNNTILNVKKFFQANGWNYIKVSNGEHTQDISAAISLAKRSSKPTVIECKTIIGFGSRFQNTNAVHGAPLTSEQVTELRENLHYTYPPFTIDPLVTHDMSVINKRGIKHQIIFNQCLNQLEIKDINLYRRFISLSNNQFIWTRDWYVTLHHTKAATRNILNEILQPLLENNPTFFATSADLSSSCLVKSNNSLFFSDKNKFGQNITYGVREFAMCAINNGIVAHGGVKTIGSTFLSFSDYCKSGIRLAAISHIPTINIFTHDSIMVGEDGPTHQPIEQIWSLRLIPNHFLFRPYNDAECEYALEFALEQKTSSTTIIGSRHVFDMVHSNIDDVKHGGYVIFENEQANITIVATGSEVASAFQIKDILKQNDIETRIVSFPCIELFEKQDINYKQSILKTLPIVSIEFGSTIPWAKYANLCIGVDCFGKSGKPNDILDFFNLTPTKIAQTITNWYNKK